MDKEHRRASLKIESEKTPETTIAADQGARAAIGFDPVARPPRQRARRPAPPPAGAASIVGQRRPTAAPAARSHQNENAVIWRRHLESARASRARIVAENG